MRLRTIATAILGFALLGGCARYEPAADVSHSDLVAPYRLDSGDELRVVVFGQNDISNTYIVDQGGKVSVPLIGFVEARNRTTAQVAADITARLASGYLRNPDVSVEVLRYRPFFAMGEVNAAGQYSYVAGMTIMAAIATAGGFSPRADRQVVTVTRNANGQVQTAQLVMTDPVMPGDTIYVRQRLF